MKTRLFRTILVPLVAVLLGSPGAAAAQGRMPHADANAIGGDVGIFWPRAAGMNTGPEVDGTFEHYIDARDSLRLDVGWMNPSASNDSNFRMRTVRIGGNLVHNWEGGQIHPFVGAGLGVYFLQPRAGGSNSGGSATKFGGTVLGGLEIFTSKTVAIKGEGRYDVVTKSGAYDPSGFSLTLGVKGYF